VSKLFLIKPPTAREQAHNLPKFACPAIGARTDKFAEVQPLMLVKESSARRARALSSSRAGGLSWTEIPLHCAASIAVRS
jgi:hypothetical protein